MSFLVQHGTCMNDAGILMKVLKSRFSEVEQHASPQQLNDYVGRNSGRKAEIIVRRNNVGHLSTDIGFERAADGNFQAHVDSDYHGEKWLSELAVDYMTHKALKIADEQESDLLESTVMPDGGRRLVFKVNA